MWGYKGILIHAWVILPNLFNSPNSANFFEKLYSLWCYSSYICESVTVNGFTTVCSCNHITIMALSLWLQTEYHTNMKQTAQQSHHENRIGVDRRNTSRRVTGKSARVGFKSKCFLMKVVRHRWGLNQNDSWGEWWGTGGV